MWAAVSSPVGRSSVPAAIETRSPEAGSQNRLDPHVSQNPRRAVADDRYQRSPSDSIRNRFSGRVAVNAARWPLVRRHMVQWQSTTGRSGPRTSYRTAPHRQPPLPLVVGDSPSRFILLRSISKGACPYGLVSDFGLLLRGSTFFVHVTHDIENLR